MAELPLTPQQDAWRMERLTRKLWTPNDPELTMQLLCRGNCYIAKDFAAEFDLIVVAGFCNHGEHFWCQDNAGNIIDPTREQFSEPRTYRELDPEKDEIQVGRCPNCCGAIYATKGQADRGEVRTDICNDECEQEYAAYIEREVSRQ